MAAPERVGRYRILEQLGQGGMATVYRAEDEELRRTVALKLMHPALAEKKEGSARFSREARAVAALRHPNVLAVHDYAPEEGDRPAYLVTELIRGPTLKQFLSQSGAPLPEAAAMIGVKLARALGAAHAAGIVHRDVKPENVMVDEGGRVVLCDFGIARMATMDTTMTATGAVIGSPAYMSPEQAEGGELDARSDLFSLGTVLYQLATGVLPFSAREPLALLAKIHRAEHAPPTAKNPRVPPWLERTIERCLRRTPEERFADATAVGDALEEGLRADGFGELDREIARYFADPAAWNAEVEGRVIASARAQAEAALASGEVARAMAQVNRLLAWRPDDEAARALLDRARRGGRFRRLALAAAVSIVVAATAATALHGLSKTPEKTRDASLISSPRPTLNPIGPIAGEEATDRPPRSPKTPETQSPPERPPRSPKKTRDASFVSSQHPNQNPIGSTASEETKYRPPRSPETSERPHRSPEKAGDASFVSSRRHAPNPIGPIAGEEATDRPPRSPKASEKPPQPPENPPSPPPDGELHLLARPYCMNGRVDGARAIGEGQRLRLPPGPHEVACEGPRGARKAQRFTVAAGQPVEVTIDFLGDTLVHVRLRRGDAVRIAGGAPLHDGGAARLPPVISREALLYKEGQLIDRAAIDIPAGECQLRDDPLECAKP